MIHMALAVSDHLAHEAIDVGIIDMYNLSTPDENALYDTLQQYQVIISVEEGFIGRGGMDSLLLNLLNRHGSAIQYTNIGIKNQYRFHVGHRESMLRMNEIDAQSVIKRLKAQLSLWKTR